MSTAAPIKVIIVDDSAVVRRVLSEVLGAASDIDVVATAGDPIVAERKMEAAWPDVVLLDIEMPRMDGLTFLRRIMETRPTPVIVCSTLTEQGAEASIEALSAGAIEVIAKPKFSVRSFLSSASAKLLQSVRAAARARVGGQGGTSPRPRPENAKRRAAERAEGGQRLVVLGSSAGGTVALETVLKDLPKCGPPIVIVQHMPEKFTAAFAQRLDQVCRYAVREASQGERLQRGTALVAPGGRHMQLQKSGPTGYSVGIIDGPPISRHKPSVDVLFRSVAHVAGADAVGVIMTGMGSDGAQGLLAMSQAGSVTVAQSKESCVVFGMPKEAIALGAADEIVALEHIAPFITAACPSEGD